MIGSEEVDDENGNPSSAVSNLKGGQETRVRRPSAVIPTVAMSKQLHVLSQT